MRRPGGGSKFNMAELFQILYTVSYGDLKKFLNKMLTNDFLHKYAGDNESQRNFREGERILEAGMLILCGKLSSDMTHIRALCLQTRQLRSSPHEINGKVEENGEIVNFSCSCPAGKSGKCKHILAALLYCNKVGDKLPVLSCTDISCSWKNRQLNVLKQFDPSPLYSHSCFSSKNNKRQRTKKTSESNLNDEIQDNLINEELESQKSSAMFKLNPTLENEIKDIFKQNLPNSAIQKSMQGRHKIRSVSQQNKFTDYEREKFKVIFENQDNALMEMIHRHQVDCVMKKCCQDSLSKLSNNGVTICENTRNWYAHWISERQYRITGSKCYNIFTYGNSKSADWNKKAKSLLTTSKFKTEAMKYGNNTEDEARKEFEKSHSELKVIQTGLIINQINPWLAYSPDGVIFKDDVLHSLLEIKCPVLGKSKTIDEVVSDQIGKCLIRKGDSIVMKTKHQYYGQVQLGMCILNLKKTYFVLYSKKDKKIFEIEVFIDNLFLDNMLKKLKFAYFNYILHEVCLIQIEKNNENTCDNINKQ